MTGLKGGLAAGALAALVLLAGCESPGLVGESKVERELERVRPRASGDFAVENASHAGADVVARGRALRLEPVEGLCLGHEAVEISPEGVFAVVTDCIGSGPDTSAGALPRAFPGMVTISVAVRPMFDAAVPRARALRRLRDFLGSAPGLRMLGRNGAGEAVRMLDSRRIGDALYVHVHDDHDSGLGLLAPGF